MAHRNSMPKPSASERTTYRWRMRHDIETIQDRKRAGLAENIRNWIYSLRHPEEADEKEESK